MSVRTASSLVYSAAAVRRMLRLTADIAVVVREWFSVVWVWVKGHRPQFWSKAKFKQHFAEFRKHQARGLTVLPATEGTFAVLNTTRDTEYTVEVLPFALRCHCRDYAEQATFITRRCCKHGYAVLFHLGFSSLSDYLTQSENSRKIS